jgi:hypothetical protein
MPVTAMGYGRRGETNQQQTKQINHTGKRIKLATIHTK